MPVNTEYDAYSAPFGEQPEPHPTGQLLGDYYPQHDFRDFGQGAESLVELSDKPIRGISSLRNILLENKQLVKLTAIGAGVLGGVTAGAVIFREQRKSRA